MDAQVAPVAEAEPRFPICSVVGNVCNLRLLVTGKPLGKGRPRFARRGNFVQTYTDDQTLTWEQNIGWQVKQQLAQLTTFRNESLPLPFEDRVIADLVFYLDRPKSIPKRVRYPIKSRTDIDNYIKSVLDALQTAAVFKNDHQVTDISASKRYTTSEDEHLQGVEIDLTAWI